MKASNKLTETDQPLISDADIPLDPFAVDIFGVSSPSVEIVLPEETSVPKPKAKPFKKSEWAKVLPKLTNREVEFSYALQDIPDGLTEKAVETITEAIARYTFREPQNVDLSIISVSETNLSEAAGKITKSPKVFFTLVAQPNNSEAVIAVNNEFAVSVIDLILGGKGAELTNLRGLSPIEKTILQFLTLNILQEINSFLGAPTLFLQSISYELKQTFAAGERGAEIVANFAMDGFSGIVSLLAPPKFLQNLDQGQNPLLRKKNERKKLNYFEKLIPNLDLRLQIGTTNLEAESLLFLEPNDIVLLENASVRDGNFDGKIEVAVGQGKDFRLSGFFDEEYNFKIEEILSEETRRKFSPAKFKMDEQQNELNETAGELNETEVSAALENVQVALRVEIAGNKLSLRELQNLRSGQVIALGCRPTDPVRLITDNNDEPVAAGELIEIEGQLGVRLTKVFI